MSSKYLKLVHYILFLIQIYFLFRVIMVVGAGRGPLVNAALRAAANAGRKVRVYAVEKNPYAVVTLVPLSHLIIIYLT
jgi:hypothetical protein